MFLTLYQRASFNSPMICIAVFFSYVTQFIMIHFFRYWSHIFLDLICQGCNNSSTRTGFTPLCVEYISIPFFSDHDFNDLL